MLWETNLHNEELDLYSSPVTAKSLTSRNLWWVRHVRKMLGRIELLFWNLLPDATWNNREQDSILRRWAVRTICGWNWLSHFSGYVIPPVILHKAKTETFHQFSPEIERCLKVKAKDLMFQFLYVPFHSSDAAVSPCCSAWAKRSDFQLCSRVGEIAASDAVNTAPFS